VFFPQDSRIICLIGAGDSGKSTLFAAIEWALWPSWSLIATDTDFYNCDTSMPIDISVSITELSESLMKEDKFGLYLRDYAKAFLGGDDEPIDGGTTILTIQNAYYRYSATEMYVAMTRAMKAIYFITDQDSVVLSVPQGI